MLKENKQTVVKADNNLFGKENYMWMVAGLVVLALGFFLMSGGKSADPKVFDKDGVYSTTRITIAPLLINYWFCVGDSGDNEEGEGG
jgi:hypothetical protein